jgi:hypothetical protein
MMPKSGDRFSENIMLQDQVDFGLLATALTGTSTMPRPAAALAQ